MLYRVAYYVALPACILGLLGGIITSTPWLTNLGGIGILVFFFGFASYVSGVARSHYNHMFSGSSFGSCYDRGDENAVKSGKKIEAGS